MASSRASWDSTIIAPLSLSSPSAWKFGTLGALFCTALAGAILYLVPPDTNTALAVLVGIAVGWLIGTAIIRRVPLAAQLTGIGTFLGMGLDELSSIVQGQAPQTAIRSLANLVKQTVEAIAEAAPIDGIPAPDPAAWAIGMWVFLGTVSAIFVFGLFASDTQ